MHKGLVILRKEFMEIVQQPVLLLRILVPWVSGGVISAEFALLADGHVVAQVGTGGWLILFIAGTPVVGLIAVAVMTAISSRVIDTRTAQQLSIWAVVPIAGIVLGDLS